MAEAEWASTAVDANVSPCCPKRDRALQKAPETVLVVRVADGVFMAYEQAGSRSTEALPSGLVKND